MRKRYMGIDNKVITILLAIIPITNVVLGVITRVERKNWLGVVLNILLCPIFWLLDLVTIIANDDLTILA